MIAVQAYRAAKVRRKDQQGAVLVISLMFLTALTLMGLFTIKSSILQERMVGNLVQQSAARQVGESALRDGERCISSWKRRPEDVTAVNPSASCDDALVLTGRDLEASESFLPLGLATHFGFDTENTSPQDLREKVYETLNSLTADEWESLAQQGQFDAPEFARKPRYFIEEVHFESDSLAVGTGVPAGRYVYQVTAVGYGQDASSYKVLQSQFLYRF